MEARVARLAGGGLLAAALALALPGIEVRACDEPGVTCSAEAAPPPPPAAAPAACQAAPPIAPTPAQRAQLRARLAAAAAAGPAVVPLDANGHNYRADGADLDSVLERIRREPSRATR
jgi:hypothetical protein